MILKGLKAKNFLDGGAPPCDTKKVSRRQKCLEWPYKIKKNGYGYIRYGGKTWGVHRLIYSLYYSSTFNPNLMVLHHCDNPKCININHLYQGNAKQNYQDRLKHGDLKTKRARKEVLVKMQKGLEIYNKRRSKQKEKIERQWNENQKPKYFGANISSLYRSDRSFEKTAS